MIPQEITVLCIIPLVLVSGCAGITGMDSGQTSNSTADINTSVLTTETAGSAGYIIVERVATPPENATVLSANNSSIRGISRLQMTLREAYGEENSTDNLSRSEFKRLKDRMPNQARYLDEPKGWYLSHRNQTFRVRIIRYIESWEGSSISGYAVNE